MSWGISLPYIKAWETGTLELFAKNHLLYGLDITKGIPVRNFLDGQPGYYRSHPPLPALLVALSFRIFGIHEWSARIIPIIFSLIAILFFYLSVENLSDRKTALLASFIIALLPMFGYYGRIVSYEPITLGISMAFLYYFIKLTRTPKKSYWAILVTATILGALIDWPFLLLFPALFVYTRGMHKSAKPCILLAILGYSIAAVFILFIKHITSSPVDLQIASLVGRCHFRTILGDSRFYQELTKRFLLNFTPIGCLFLLFWMIGLSKKMLPINKEINLLAASLCIFGFLWIIVAPQATYIHVWALQYLAPGIALACALALSRFTRIWRVFFMSLFIIFSLAYLTKLHIVKYPGAYEAGKIIAENASPKDILYTNVVSPVSFYSGIESRFFFVEKETKNPGTFIIDRRPRFVCIIKYAAESRLDYDAMSGLLRKEGYKIIYDTNEAVLWSLS